jgi:hypothetical protein
MSPLRHTTLQRLLFTAAMFTPPLQRLCSFSPSRCMFTRSKILQLSFLQMMICLGKIVTTRLHLNPLADDSLQVEFIFTVPRNLLTMLLTTTYAAFSVLFLLAVVAEQPWVRRMLEDSTVPVSLSTDDWAPTHPSDSEQSFFAHWV